MDSLLLKRITVIPGLIGGRPIIRGIRFQVSDVLGYLAAGMTEEELLQNFRFWKKIILEPHCTMLKKKIIIP